LSYINLNGKLLASYEAAVSYDNRAFRYGYGLFETILVKDGAIALADYHFERLFSGMQQLYFSVPKYFDAASLTNEILRTAKKNHLEKLCRVRLQVYEGPGGLYDAVSQQPEYIIECFPLEAHILSLNENGLVAGIATGMFKAADNLSYLKSCNALIYAVAAQQARQQKWNDALICNNDGNIIESTIANIFWIKDREVFTPPIAAGCIAGVMRRHLLEMLPAKGFTVSEQPLTPEKLVRADEVFLTNAIRGVKWIKEVADKGYSCNITRDIATIVNNGRLSV
jgi:branched-chain amino acid aminotransferase